MSPGSLTADSAFALGMLAVLLGAFAVVLILVVPIWRNAGRGASEAPDHLPEKGGDIPPEDPPAPPAKPWKRIPNGGKKAAIERVTFRRHLHRPALLVLAHLQGFHYSRTMESAEAIVALSALAQEARLGVFRLLVRAGASGMAAGEIAAALNLPANTLSFHLKELSRAQLIASERSGRHIRYAIKPDGIRDLLGFLTEDCCAGNPSLCGGPNLSCSC